MTTTYVTMTGTGCTICDIPFSVPKSLWDRGRTYGGNLWCPNGHKMTFGKSEVERLRADRASLTARLDQEKARAATLERSRNAVKGELTKAKKRAAGGACPCCNRTFVQLSRHMATKHPDFVQHLTDGSKQ